MNSIKKATEVLEKGLDLSKRADNAARIHGKTFYAMLFRVIVISTVFIAIGVWSNLNGFMSINIGLSFASIIIGTLTFTHPEILVTVANIDVVNRALPDNMQIDALDEIFEQFIKTSKRIIALCCITFLFLGTVPIGDNVKVFYVVFLSILIVLLIDIDQKVKEKK